MLIITAVMDVVTTALAVVALTVIAAARSRRCTPLPPSRDNVAMLSTQNLVHNWPTSSSGILVKQDCSRHAAINRLIILESLLPASLAHPFPAGACERTLNSVFPRLLLFIDPKSSDRTSADCCWA